MSKCQACGGDGLIEVGAYRGDESDTTTRECRLCGGAVTTSTATALAELGFAAETAAQSLVQLAQAGSSPSASILPRLFESTSGSRCVVEIAVPAPLSDAGMTPNAHGFYESREPVPLRPPAQPKCNGSHDWQLVKYVNAGRVVKCRACDKMKYRKQ